MCSKFLKQIIGLNAFGFLKKMTIGQHHRLIAILLIIMLIGLFFAKEIHKTEGILKILIIFAAILYLIVTIINYIKGLMLTQADWKNEFVAFYYCLWLGILIYGLFVLIYKFFSLVPPDLW